MTRETTFYGSFNSRSSILIEKNSTIIDRLINMKKPDRSVCHCNASNGKLCLFSTFFFFFFFSSSLLFILIVYRHALFTICDEILHFVVLLNIWQDVCMYTWVCHEESRRRNLFNLCVWPLSIQYCLICRLLLLERE